MGSATWKITKRLTEFETWDKKLRATIAAQVDMSMAEATVRNVTPLTKSEAAGIEHQMPSLPPKKSWRDDSESWCKATSQGLFVYVTKIICINLEHDRDMFRQELRDFLRIDEEIAKHVATRRLERPAKTEAAQLMIERQVYKEHVEGMEQERAKVSVVQQKQTETLFNQLMNLQDEIDEASCRINLAIAETKKHEVSVSSALFTH